MKPSNRAKTTTYIVSGIWSLFLFLSGVSLPGADKKIISFLPIAVVLLFAAYDNLLWKLGPVVRFAKQPNLNGTWEGTLTSMQSNYAGVEEKAQPIRVYLVIRQSFTSLSIRLLSEKAKSRSMAASVQANDDEDFSIFYHYHNVSDLEVREKSPIHFGGARLDVTGYTPASFKGEYWTSRRTRGTFNVKLVTRKRYGSYDQAVESLAGGN